jgi:hypothetical protein
MSDVTHCLDRVQQIASEAPGQTLQPTALVHEAWLRLIGDANQMKPKKHLHWLYRLTWLPLAFLAALTTSTSARAQPKITQQPIDQFVDNG